MSRDNPYFRFNLWNLTGKTSCFLYKVVNEKGIHRVDEKRQSRQEEEKEGGRRRRRRRRWLAPPPPARLTGGCLEQCQWVVKAPRVGRLLLLQGGQGGQGGALRAGSLWPRSPHQVISGDEAPTGGQPHLPTQPRSTRETSVVIQSEKFRVVLHPSSIIIVWRPLSRRLNDC